MTIGQRLEKTFESTENFFHFLLDKAFLNVY